MKTSAIPYRVADFLKQHPPFEYMDSPTWSHSPGGGAPIPRARRVHFWQASPHTPFISVIQQGSVSLLDESADPPTLCDIRG